MFTAPPAVAVWSMLVKRAPTIITWSAAPVAMTLFKIAVAFVLAMSIVVIPIIVVAVIIISIVAIIIFSTVAVVIISIVNTSLLILIIVIMPCPYSSF